jgi:hypothetical protein
MTAPTPMANVLSAGIPTPPFVASAVPNVPQVSSIETGSDGVVQTVSQCSFPTFMTKLTAAFAANQVTQEQIAAAVQACGVPSVMLLGSRVDLIPAVAAALGITL